MQKQIQWLILKVILSQLILVSGGFGYQTPPSVQVIDPCRNGTGAVLSTEIQGGVVVRVIVNDSGSGLSPT